MNKSLIIGLIAGAAAVTAAVVYYKKKSNSCCCDDFDDELDCDYCDDCCDCGESCAEIPAEKAEENGVIITDACTAGSSDIDELNSLDDDSKSDQA